MVTSPEMIRVSGCATEPVKIFLFPFKQQVGDECQFRQALIEPHAGFLLKVYQKLNFSVMNRDRAKRPGLERLFSSRPPATVQSGSHRVCNRAARGGDIEYRADPV